MITWLKAKIWGEKYFSFYKNGWCLCVCVCVCEYICKCIEFLCSVVIRLNQGDSDHWMTLAWLLSLIWTYLTGLSEEKLE